ncbi:lysophospholipase L1-like esterase [Rhizomicrobium palustre]|uniref:Lysophospholipase L1-like esterase n=1 Tax=Rhizomicrobium palustre TaxID=189966 RepID=A0A846MTT4_9PROT|nr:SGNH/GDSL hydrolase family protein [Rhizomicrobium palustre]NIK86763.1 lysophospholipase L1-like esterase [Rhizomicrobium palustre]
MNHKHWQAVALAAFMLAAPAFAGSAQTYWTASWTASPFDGAKLPAKFFTPSIAAFENQTIRQTITLSRGGTALRIRFSNEFGVGPLRIGAASLAYVSGGQKIHVPLTFGGATAITAYASAPVVSDPVAAALPDGAEIEVSLYLPDNTPVSTIHLLGLQPSFVSQAGNHVAADTLPGATAFEYVEATGNRYPARAFLSEVDVSNSKKLKTVVAFGDSITDGMGSTPNQSRRWPDDLARRIVQAKLPFSVINQGIGGNQVLANGLGASALARFDRDALAVPGVSTVILLEGINDIGFSGNMLPGISRVDVIKAEEIIQGYRQLIARAHAKGVRIIGVTMTAFEGSPAYTAEKEAVRQAVNAWIRSSKAFDAVVDFDAVTRDAASPTKLKATFDSGDHIHLNDAGYAAMAAAIPLSAL